MPARRRVSRWTLVGALCLSLLAPVPASAAIPEFIALVLYFYLLQQPQMMNNTQDVVDANLKAADAITRSRLEIWGKEVSMAMLPPPQSCVSLALAKGLRAVDGLTPGLVNQQINQQINTITGNLNPLQEVVNRVRRHERHYCSESDRARGRCVPASTGGLPNGDLDAGLLLDTRGYTPEQLAAATAFVDNLTTPAPIPPLPPQLEKSPQADQLRGYLLTYAARKAVARKALANAVADRTRHHDIATPAGNSAPQSPQEVLYNDYERRFGDAQWTDEILRAPPGALEREKLMMETWKMQMEMRRYRQAQDTQVLLATLLDVLTEQQGEPQITRLTEVAMRARVE